MWITLLAVATSGVCLGQTTGPAGDGRPREMEMAAGWARVLLAPSTVTDTPTAAKVLPTKSDLPFSFLYGSEKSGEILSTRKRAETLRVLDDARSEQIVTYADPKTGLEVRVEAISYKDFPAVEWVLFFTNTGSADTPILQDILPLDARLSVAGASRVIVHYAKGAVCSIDDFAPVDKVMEPGSRLHLQPGGGRSSSEFLPFFNLDTGKEGVVIAVGWTGEWAADFDRDQPDSLHVQAGMARTCLRLHPGEQIRTPRLLMLFWQDARMRGNNLLRRFLLTHRRCKPGGKPIVLPVLVGSWGGMAAADHLKTIRGIVSRDLPVGLYWIDAEWFGQAPWYKSPGNWQVRKDLYPEGFQAISEPLHRSGRRFLLWFEPQRVCQGTAWCEFKDRPNWLLELKNGEPAYQQRNMNWGVPHEDPRWVLWESRRSRITEGDLLWNMGEPAARQFLTDWLSERIKEFGLDWYREDFNVAPLEYWQGADAADRQGMTEIRYIEGLYAMWDELLRRDPHLAIDNCASGGRRMDLETIGRSTALWRTDWPADAIHKQCHTFGLLAWVPLNMSGGTVMKKGNEYEIRSAMTAGLNVELRPQDDEESTRQTRASIEQYLSIQKYYYGDYYPLTQYSQTPDAWMAYQLHLPTTQEGLVVVLKRPASPRDREVFRLNDMDLDATYEVTNLDSGQTRTVAGAGMVRDGVQVSLGGKPDSALIRYRKTKIGNQ